MGLKEKIKTLPSHSGVYLMKDAGGRVLYIGKAVSLQKRVRSYFRKKIFQGQSTSRSPDPKTRRLVAEVHDVDYISTDSEAEALILESSLIKKFKPKYNIDLRDDKSYPLIEVTKEKFPKISVVRPRTSRVGLSKPSSQMEAKYYGPYVNARLIREALGILRKIFHFRTCHSFPNKPCLDYHIGLCDAPCVGNINARPYGKIIKNVCFILEGKKDKLLNSLRGDMERCAQERKFEEAAKIRDQIRALGALYSGTKDINYYKEAEQLQRVLNISRQIQRIEAFDVSSIMGEHAVGSMVSFLNGRPDKSQYRRFRIREVKGIDDFKMIAEVIRRRYHRLKQEGRLFPDLVVIDGGKGQLSSARQQLDELGLALNIISIAKKQEEIFLPNRRTAIVLSRNSLGLKLLQRVRDEAHRFAICYHRHLRQRKTLNG